MEEKIEDILENNTMYDGVLNKTKAITELLILFGVSKNEAICNCENEYWKEDEGGDWYCTIHDKQE